MELADEERPAERTIDLGTGSRAFALPKLKFKLESSQDDLKVLHIGHDRRIATISMTDIGLALVRRAFIAWLEGKEDFGVSPRHSTVKQCEWGQRDRESGELWFWGPSYAGP